MRRRRAFSDDLWAIVARGWWGPRADKRRGIVPIKEIALRVPEGVVTEGKILSVAGIFEPVIYTRGILHRLDVFTCAHLHSPGRT
ncbi:hypothetical protein E2C01_047772 [Portunus trituberculatus]|uniref:Uncharacterized protein n=1 Tax=Portunus trituberculatus TaxID=210409 RepID=A0A5B7G8D5_PORTR|nr:hypothetical protein [Portunus trituberculatus]